MHRVTAVVFNPELKRVESTYKGEIIEFEVAHWYLAMDRLVDEWRAMHPTLFAAYGVDELEIRAMTMMRIAD